MMDVIFMISFGSSKLATGAAQRQPGADRELSEGLSSPGEAQKQPRRRSSGKEGRSARRSSREGSTAAGRGSSREEEQQKRAREKEMLYEFPRR